MGNCLKHVGLRVNGLQPKKNSNVSNGIDLHPNHKSNLDIVATNNETSDQFDQKSGKKPHCKAIKLPLPRFFARSGENFSTVDAFFMIILPDTYVPCN